METSKIYNELAQQAIQRCTATLSLLETFKPHFIKLEQLAEYLNSKGIPVSVCTSETLKLRPKRILQHDDASIYCCDLQKALDDLGFHYYLNQFQDGGYWCLGGYLEPPQTGFYSGMMEISLHPSL